MLPTRPITGIMSMSIQDLKSQLMDNDETLTEIDLPFSNIGDKDVKLLSEGLLQNSTVTKINLFAKNIGDEGARALGTCLRINVTVIALNLWGNSIVGSRTIGDEGARMLADGLRDNTTLKFLELGNNDISDKGAKALAECLRHNSTLTTLRLECNTIGDTGASVLVEALHHNVTLHCLTVYGNDMDKDSEYGIETMTDWNVWGALVPYIQDELPLPCQEKVLCIVLILHELPICDDFHPFIMGMLKVRDIVNHGDPKNMSTWT